MRLFYRYANAANAFRGLHIADPFSGYSPYGRHNREYTPAELRTLPESCDPKRPAGLPEDCVTGQASSEGTSIGE